MNLDVFLSINNYDNLIDIIYNFYEKTKRIIRSEIYKTVTERSGTALHLCYVTKLRTQRYHPGS